MTLNLTLYTFKASLWGAVPRLAINELSISNVKQIEVDIPNASNFSPSYLNINPKHTVPALEIDVHGTKKHLNDTTSVINCLNEITGSKLSIPEKKAEIDEFIREMHEEADIGNILFLTSGSKQELEAKKTGMTGFLENRIQYLQAYLKEAPNYADIYHKSIQESQSMLNVYQGITDTKTMFARNIQLWEVGKKFLEKAESLLNSNGDHLFGRHSVADLHFVPYLFRILIVRKPEQVFENRLALKAYYERAQVRPSFSKTFK